MMICIDILCWIALAYTLVGSIPAIHNTGERFALAVTLALGLKSLFLFVMIACGIQPGPILQLAFSAVVFFTAGWIYRRKCAETGENMSAARPSTRPDSIVFIILGILLIFSLANALFFPITETDALWYEIRGMRLFHEIRFDLDTFNQEYPPFVPLLFAYQVAFDITQLKALFPVFYFCLLVVLYCRVRAGGGSEKLAAVLTLVLGTTPYLWWHSVLPFLNLISGFYFALGVIYWFFLINEVLDPKADHAPAGRVRLAGLCGTLFGLAAWTRLEFLLYGGLAMVAFAVALSQAEGMAARLKSRLFRIFSIAVLVLPTAWFVCVHYFQMGGDSRIRAIELICGVLWLSVLVLPLLISRVRLGKLAILSSVAALAALFLLALVIGGPRGIATVNVIFLGAYRTLFFNGYFAFTVFVALLIFLEPLRNWSLATKFLGGFLLAYLCVHFALYTYMPPKWDALTPYIDATFIHPGKAANSSGTREMLAFYPILIFFVSRLPRVRASFGNE